MANKTTSSNDSANVRAIMLRSMLSMVALTTIFLTGFGTASSSSVAVPASKNGSLQYFGYALVDCGIDDPADAVDRRNYVTEVASFSNVAQMCVFDPSENIVDRLQLMSKNDLKALLSVQAIFFVGNPDATQGSGMNFDLHPQYQARWQRFVGNNNLSQNISAIAAFYVADEPVWNGITFTELKTAADAIKASFASVPTAIIEAPHGIRRLQVPLSIDWIGFDRYAVATPDTDPEYNSELALLKSKRSRPGQKLLLVMDAQWLPFYGEAGYLPRRMKAVASRYYNVAKSDPDIVGIIGYLWPGGFDDADQMGARNLPMKVIDEHVRIGKLITGK